MFWDFISLRPETTHQTVLLFSDRGIPDGYRHMNGYGSHTYKFVNDRDEMVYVKYHFKVNGGHLWSKYTYNTPPDPSSRFPNLLIDP